MSDSYPALIELIGRLEGKDKKTCETALYCLKKQDKRIEKLQKALDIINELHRETLERLNE